MCSWRIKLQLNKKIIIFIFLILIIIVGLNYDDSLSFKVIKQHYGDLQLFIDEKFLFYYLLFFFAYIIVTALALPISLLKTLLAGALFGLLPGVILTSFASTIGSTLCFLLNIFRYPSKAGTSNSLIVQEWGVLPSFSPESSLEFLRVP